MSGSALRQRSELIAVNASCIPRTAGKNTPSPASQAGGDWPWGRSQRWPTALPGSAQGLGALEDVWGSLWGAQRG